MKKKIVPTLKWDDAPDTITPEDLRKILGIGSQAARKIFEKADFPKLPTDITGITIKADKEMARLYIQGIKLKQNNSRDSLLSMIYFELKKLNNEREVTNDEKRKETEQIY